MTHTAHFTLALSPAGVHPGSQPTTARPPTFDDWAVPASVAERAGIDAVFLPDSPAVAQEGGRRGSLEPLMLLAALARETSTIGLIGTASTSFNEPYNVARQFASLHAISGERAGWNSVGTSNPGAAANFGVSWWQDHDRRYRVGQEFTEIVLRLWQAGEDPIDHVGEFFAVRGPLDVTAVGGDRPLITQAGGSPEGIRLGARFADVTFAILADLTAAKEYDRRLRDAEAAAGRTPGTVRVLPGVVPYLADTPSDAAAYKEDLDARLDLAPLLPVVARYLHLDLDVLRGLAPDETFPLELLPTPDQVDNSVATFTSLRSVIERTHPTTRQVVVKASGGNRHRELVGTPDDFADDVEEWLDAGVADGFTLLLPATGRDLTYFADSVTPVLRDRGLLPATPAAGPLRARLT